MCTVYNQFTTSLTKAEVLSSFPVPYEEAPSTQNSNPAHTTNTGIMFENDPTHQWF